MLKYAYNKLTKPAEVVFMIKIGNDWDKVLSDYFASEHYSNLRNRLALEYKNETIYPSAHDIFAALKLTSLSDTKVVILGQDPYHGEHQAHGLSFSVNRGVAVPPSLRNIFTELKADISGFTYPEHGCLKAWAQQGVLLLNTVLTVRAGQANSHKNLGWQVFTDRVICALSQDSSPKVFFLWGKPAQQKAQLITSERHLILNAPHPSPLSAHRGFFGCGHFSKANAFLQQHGKEQIDWRL